MKKVCRMSYVVEEYVVGSMSYVGRMAKLWFSYILHTTYYILPLLSASSAWAQEPLSSSTFAVTMEAIPSGVVFLFPAPKDLSERMDHFIVYRSSKTAMKEILKTPSASLDAYQLGDLNYYHDWYKDYFYAADVGQNYYYHVEAYDLQGRLVAVSEPAWTLWKVREPPPSGIMLTPTAYRRMPLYPSAISGTSHILPINIDLNASYYIGRLYSFNRLTELTNTRHGLFSRVGVWFVQMDGKVILERESRGFPQLAAGAEGTMMVQDNRQPSFQDPGIPGFTVKKETSRRFTGTYLAASKEIGIVRTTLGWVRGDAPSKIIYLTEFLAKESESDFGMFVSMHIKAGKRFTLQWEMVRLLHAKESPLLINLNVGRALHTNFDLAYLSYDRGYELQAHINFRFTMYPAAGKKK